MTVVLKDGALSPFTRLAFADVPDDTRVDEGFVTKVGIIVDPTEKSGEDVPARITALRRVGVSEVGRVVDGRIQLYRFDHFEAGCRTGCGDLGQVEDTAAGIADDGFVQGRTVAQPIIVVHPVDRHLGRNAHVPVFALDVGKDVDRFSVCASLKRCQVS